jgi:hypothetical protein
MEKQIYIELQEIKSLLAKLIGTADNSADERFSIEAVEMAAKQFQKLSIEREEWVKDSDIQKYIKNAPYNAGL